MQAMGLAEGAASVSMLASLAVVITMGLSGMARVATGVRRAAAAAAATKSVLAPTLAPLSLPRYR